MKRTILIIATVIGLTVIVGGGILGGLLLGVRIGSPNGSQHVSASSINIPAQPVNGQGQTAGSSRLTSSLKPEMAGNPCLANWDSGSDPAAVMLDNVCSAAQKFLAGYHLDSFLKIERVILFNQDAYVRVVERSSGVGAFELLVTNPPDLAVSPEPGADLEWNLKYGALMQQVLAGTYSGSPSFPAVSAALTVSPQQAVKDAQDWLDKHLTGDRADSAPYAFYGYYTVEVLEGSKVVGLLSVNGSNGEVFYLTSRDN
jgi:hypothetical protein